MVEPEHIKDDSENFNGINGNGGNFNPAHLKTAELMVTKLGMGDDVGDPYVYAEFHYNLIRGFCSPPRMRVGVQSDSAS